MYGNNDEIQFANGLSDRRRQPSFLPRNSGGLLDEIDHNPAHGQPVSIFLAITINRGNGNRYGDGVHNEPDRQV